MDKILYNEDTENNNEICQRVMESIGIQCCESVLFVTEIDYKKSILMVKITGVSSTMFT